MPFDLARLGGSETLMKPRLIRVRDVQEPSCLSASIELLPYDSTWPSKFELERQALQALLSPWLVGPIEHIGSTAVPGLIAKPVIDMMAPVENLAASRDAIALLEGTEYCYAPYKAEEMHWFCKPSPSLRTHHLHLVPKGSSRWEEVLRFRDALRSQPTRATEYALLKQELAKQHKDDREAYTQAKTHFIRSVLAGTIRGG